MNDHPDFDDVIDNWATIAGFDLKGYRHFPALHELLIDAGFCMDRLEDEDLPEPTPRQLLTGRLNHPSSPIGTTISALKTEIVDFIVNTCDELGLFDDPPAGWAVPSPACQVTASTLRCEVDHEPSFQPSALPTTDDEWQQAVGRRVFRRGDVGRSARPDKKTNDATALAVDSGWIVVHEDGQSQPKVWSCDRIIAIEGVTFETSGC